MHESCCEIGKPIKKDLKFRRMLKEAIVVTDFEDEEESAVDYECYELKRILVVKILLKNQLIQMMTVVQTG